MSANLKEAAIANSPAKISRARRMAITCHLGAFISPSNLREIANAIRRAASDSTKALYADARAHARSGRRHWCQTWRLVCDLKTSPGLCRHQVAHQEAHLLQGVVQQGEPAGGFQGVLAGLPKLHNQCRLPRDPRLHQVNMLTRGGRGPVHTRSS